jgi:hypothetical protein
LVLDLFFALLMGARWATATDPEILRILLNSARSKLTTIRRNGSITRTPNVPAYDKKVLFSSHLSNRINNITRQSAVKRGRTRKTNAMN